MNLPTHIEEKAIKDKFSYAVTDGKLDITKIPKDKLDKFLKKFRQFLILENKLKNVVIRKLTEIRVEKAKPSLKSMITGYLTKQREKDERARMRIKD